MPRIATRRRRLSYNVRARKPLRIAFGNLTIDRDDLSGSHKNSVPDGDVIYRRVFDCLAALPVGETRRAIYEGFQIAFCSSDREIFQQIAAGIHDGDDHPRQILAERQRRRH